NTNLTLQHLAQSQTGRMVPRVPPDMDIRPKSADDQDWIRKLLTEHWGGTLVVAHGERFHANALPALVAGDRQGLATYRVAAGGLEAGLVPLDAAAAGAGAATGPALGGVRRSRGQ